MMTTLFEKFNKFVWTQPKYWFIDDSNDEFYTWDLWWTNDAKSAKFWLGNLVLILDAETKAWACQSFFLPDDTYYATTGTHWWELTNEKRTTFSNSTNYKRGAECRSYTHKSPYEFNLQRRELEGLAKFMLMQIPKDAQWEEDRTAW